MRWSRAVVALSGYRSKVGARRRCGGGVSPSAATPGDVGSVRTKTRTVPELAGSLKSPRNEPVSIDDMNPWH